MTPRRFDPTVPEMMDRPGNDPALLRADLEILETINRWLGGHRIPLSHLRDQYTKTVSRETLFVYRSLSILDLATGAADVPRAIASWARRIKLPVEITAVDGNPQILDIARERSTGYPEIRFEQHDLRALPYKSGSFDFVLCALVLHHFSGADAIAILRRIHDIARVGYIVNDLRRNRLAIGLSKLMAHTIITNPIARFDAPASCERAFSMDELRAMAQQAGMEHFSVRKHPIFRMALVGRK
jgi:2-polyprenyl-3-methyl-5-hydroxy-6-metoxy-1,4-benzoquinol methylase